MSSFQMLKVSGNWFPGHTGEVLGMTIFNLGLVLWFLVPLFDTASRVGRRARIATWFGLVGQRDLLALGISTIGSGTFTQVTRSALIILMTSATICGVVYFMAYRAPRQFAWPHALAILFLALAATGSTEYARELIRKPYVVGRHIYVNGVRQSQVERLNREGYLSRSLWVGSGRGDVSESTASGGPCSAASAFPVIR
jgi:hypothetical protein